QHAHIVLVSQNGVADTGIVRGGCERPKRRRVVADNRGGRRRGGLGRRLGGGKREGRDNDDERQSCTHERLREGASYAWLSLLALPIHSARCTVSYGITTMGARQNAAFWPSGSSSVTWQSYRPGASEVSGTLNATGTAPGPF